VQLAAVEVEPHLPIHSLIQREVVHPVVALASFPVAVFRTLTSVIQGDWEFLDKEIMAVHLAAKIQTTELILRTAIRELVRKIGIKFVIRPVEVERAGKV
jgi:acetylglutamate kinase